MQPLEVKVMNAGVWSDEIIHSEHVNRFKKIFGNEINFIKVRAKFKYGVNSCALCAR